MVQFKLFSATSSKMVCRGNDIQCIAIKDEYHRALIPKGSKTLSVSVYGAGGSQTAYYCEVCMYHVLEDMKRFLEEIV